MRREDAPGGNPSPGVLDSLRNLAATAVGIAQTRIQLLANELEEQRIRALQLVVLGAMAMFFGAMAVLLLTTLLVVAFWEQHRLWTLGVLTVLYAAGCFGVLAMLKSRAAHRPRMFSASLAELRRDEEALRTTDAR
jgi:uncharacterized membrane protein YqjE